MGDDMFRTEHDMRLSRLDPEGMGLHGKRIAFDVMRTKPCLWQIEGCLAQIKLCLEQIVLHVGRILPHLLFIDAEDWQIKACLLFIKRQEE